MTVYDPVGRWQSEGSVVHGSGVAWVDVSETAALTGGERGGILPWRQCDGGQRVDGRLDGRRAAGSSSYLR